MRTAAGIPWILAAGAGAITAGAITEAAATAPAPAAMVRPMRGWMTWERFTCETDCKNFPETCISEHLIMSMGE